jgi:hypothetical protein
VGAAFVTKYAVKRLARFDNLLAASMWLIQRH